MSATNSTANYGLPIFVSSDVPSWLTDWNGAMGDIDTAIAAAKATADSALLASGNNTTDITTIQGQITTMQTTIGTHTTQIGTISGNINTINSLIGNGTPTTTDQTIIGAINELHADQGDLADLTTTDKSSLVAAINEAAQGGGGAPAASTVSYDNTGSGLTATNVQDAIDEIAGASAGSISVTGDGSKTNSQLLDELFALIDFSKVSSKTKFRLEIAAGNTRNYSLVTVGTTNLQFSRSFANASGVETVSATIRTSGSTLHQITCATGGTISFADSTSTALTSGQKYVIGRASCRERV